MELSTYSKIYDFTMPMIYLESDELIITEKNNERFALIFIENGKGIIKLNNVNIFFVAPVMFCINEKDSVLIDKNLGLEIKVIYFHPGIINSVLNFENIRNSSKEFHVTTIQDCYLLEAFTNRNDKYHGIIHTGEISGKHINLLFEHYKNEVALQNSMHWPCRSRSYIMEILFYIDNILLNTEINDDLIIDDCEDEISIILLFLIKNYDKKITIPELTKQFNMNRTTLSEKFIKATGESVISYVNKLRINIASMFLRDTKLPISEIMTRVGFNDDTHFLRTFKGITGMSPKKYRDAYCWM